MAVGDITASQEGIYNISSATLLTKLATLNVGGSNASLEASSIYLVPSGTGDVSIIKITRSNS